MRQHRFIVDSNLTPGSLVISDQDLVAQWRTVLRLVAGDHLILTDGRGLEAEAVIDSYNKDSAVVTIGHVTDDFQSDRPHLTLCCAVLKKENFELVCQKATEIGVGTIIPVVTTRTVKLGLNFDRLVKIVKEAVEQSGQAIVPEIKEISEFEDIINIEVGRKIIFDKSGKRFEKGKNNPRTAILIGPEGGFDEKEIKMAEDNGWEVVSLGSSTLRAETAAIIASYLAC